MSTSIKLILFDKSGKTIICPFDKSRCWRWRQPSKILMLFRLCSVILISVRLSQQFNGLSTSSSVPCIVKCVSQGLWHKMLFGIVTVPEMKCETLHFWETDADMNVMHETFGLFSLLTRFSYMDSKVFWKSSGFLRNTEAQSLWLLHSKTKLQNTSDLTKLN